MRWRALVAVIVTVTVPGAGTASAAKVTRLGYVSRDVLEGNPALVAGPQGRVAAAWDGVSSGRDERPLGFKVTERNADGRWGAPQTVIPDAVEDAAIAYLPSGDLLILYARKSGRYRTIRAVTWNPAGRPRPEAVLTGYADDEDVSGLQVRTDARGGAVVVWTVQRLRGAIDTAAAILEPAGRWRPAVTLPGRLWRPALAVAPDGAAVAFGQSADASLQLTQRSPDGDFGPSARVAPPAGSLEFQVVPEVTVAAGEFVAAWQRTDAGVSEVRTLTGRFGEPVGPATLLAGFRNGPSYDEVDLDANLTGLAAMAWYTGNGGVAQLSTRTPGGAFGPPRTLGRADGSAPEVAVCENGTVYASFARFFNGVQPRPTLLRLTDRAQRVRGVPARFWTQELVCVGNRAVALTWKYLPRQDVAALEVLSAR